MSTRRFALLTILLATLILAGQVLVKTVNASPSVALETQNSSYSSDQADPFFNDGYVHEIRLTFDDPGWYSNNDDVGDG